MTSQNPLHHPAPRTDTAVPERYRADELPALTGFSLTDLFWLEFLGAFPFSDCQEEEGRSWPASDIDDWLRFLAEPGVRAWVESLLRGPSDDQAH